MLYYIGRTYLVRKHHNYKLIYFRILFQEAEEIKSFDAMTKANNLLKKYENLNYPMISKTFFLGKCIS